MDSQSTSIQIVLKTHHVCFGVFERFRLCVETNIKRFIRFENLKKNETRLFSLFLNPFIILNPNSIRLISSLVSETSLLSNVHSKNQLHQTNLNSSVNKFFSSSATKNHLLFSVSSSQRICYLILSNPDIIHNL